MCIRDRQFSELPNQFELITPLSILFANFGSLKKQQNEYYTCLLYTSDAADERSSVDLGGRRIIKKKKRLEYMCYLIIQL